MNRVYHQFLKITHDVSRVSSSDMEKVSRRRGTFECSCCGVRRRDHNQRRMGRLEEEEGERDFRITS